ncbi:MAG: MBOAT family O-acyltransferase, partial [Phycisphaerae bacterium]
STFMAYVAAFPQLVAGPIMRAGDFLPQLSREPRLDSADFSAGVYRVFRGLFKKMVVADTLALYVDMVFHTPEAFTGVSAWIALYAYAFQIYMDFSGYCDVAVGVGRLLGLKLAENFNRPYLACSPSEFWRRWHITLSTWLRDYLYIPLGGSRGGRLLTARNVLITMTLGGLWHGAAWTFVAWGLYQGLLLIGERLILRSRRLIDPATLPAGTRILRMTVMFHLMCLGWLLFRAPDWHTVTVMGANLFDFSATAVHGLRVAVLIAACMAAHALPAVHGLGDRFARVPGFGQGALAAACMWVLLIGGPKSQSFIYFQF